MNDDELMDLAQSAATVQEAADQLHEAFDIHVTYHLARARPGAADDPFVRTTYPSDWIARYLTAQYVRIDPVVAEGFQRILPFDWEDLEVTEASLEMMRESKSYGVGVHGYSVPILDSKGRRALFSVNADLADEEWVRFRSRYAVAIVEVAHIVHAKALVEVFGTEDGPTLSARETEVLTWSARGKDYKTIAIIMELSPHTTKAYMRSIRHKLGAVTMAQCVARAIRLGLIYPEA